jgi:hypothetical protein
MIRVTSMKLTQKSVNSVERKLWDDHKKNVSKQEIKWTKTNKQLKEKNVNAK